MNDDGSSLLLMIGFFIVAGLLLTGGVTASAAFLAQRDLQSGCDGAAIAGAAGFDRSAGTTISDLSFDDAVARAAIATYAADAWGADAATVAFDVDAVGARVIVTCSRTVHVPFETIFSPGGVRRTASSSADAPVVG